MISRAFKLLAVASFVWSVLPASAYDGSGLPKDELVEADIGDYIDGTGEPFKKLPETVEALNIYGRTPYDLSVLQRFKKLRRLEIGGAEYAADTKGLATLATLPIESLSIRNDEDGAGLSRVLSQFKSLKNLGLISYSTKIALGDISKIRTLEGLNLQGEVSGSLGSLRSCPRLRFLQLSFLKDEPHESILRGIASVEQLEHLCIQSYMPPSILREICSLPNLRSLDVSNRNLTDADMRTIAKLPRLEILNLSGNPITDQGVKNLLPLKHLRALKLSETSITDSAFESLSAFPVLEDLDVISTKTDASGLKYFQKPNHLRRLVLSAVLNRNLEPVKNLTSLQYLVLRGAKIDETGAHFIAQSKSVRYLNIGLCEDKKVVERLRGMGSLQEVSSYGSDDEIRQLFSSLRETLGQKPNGTPPIEDEPMIHDLHDIRDWTCF